MVKTILKEVKEYKFASIITPCFMVLEVAMEMMIPYLMASIIDKGVEVGNMAHIYKIGGLMIVIAVIGLLAGLGGARYGAQASTGLAKNLRETMFNHIQTFSFANIDKFSTAGLVTRMTTDITNIQNAYQMILRMCVRTPITLVCALAMSFYISKELASVYLIAVIILGFILILIMKNATKYFSQAFPRYDDMNAAVQENVSAIRVVKAYVREKEETAKFRKTSKNIYDLFVKAEKIISFNAPVMNITVYSCILIISWIGAKMIVAENLSTG